MGRYIFPVYKQLESFSYEWETYGTELEQSLYDCEKLTARRRDRGDLGFRMNPCRDRVVPCAVVFHSHTKSALPSRYGTNTSIQPITARKIIAQPIRMLGYRTMMP